MFKHISLTPEPKVGTFRLTQVAEVAEVCVRLGLSPCDLQPKMFSANLSRLTNYKSPPRPLKSTPRLKAPSPSSGLELWTERYEKLCSRIDTTRRVLSNKQRLQAEAALDFQAAQRSDQERERKKAETQKAKEREWQSRAKALQSRRDLMLRRVQAVGLIQARESAEIRALSESPMPGDRVGFAAKASPLVSRMSVQRTNDGDISLKLAEIEERLKEGAKRAQENKRTISISARSRVDPENRRNSPNESETERLHKERIRALKQSSELHLRNKQLRLSETRRKLNAARSAREGKAKQLLACKEGLQKSLETSYYARQIEREEQVERLQLAKTYQMEQKSMENEARYSSRKAAQQALKDLSFACKDNILSRLRHSDQTVNSIRQIQDKIRRLRLLPSN